jgi:hypothetical protein
VRTFARAACGSDGDLVDLSQSPDAAWAETDELRVAERSNPQLMSYVRPEEAAERKESRPCSDVTISVGT